jgi:hypothetical protein
MKVTLSDLITRRNETVAQLREIEMELESASAALLIRAKMAQGVFVDRTKLPYRVAKYLDGHEVQKR